MPVTAPPAVGCGHGLSEREEQILKALVRGHSNKMIARMYSVTEATVKVHMKSICGKSGLRTGPKRPFGPSRTPAFLKM